MLHKWDIIAFKINCTFALNMFNRYLKKIKSQIMSKIQQNNSTLIPLLYYSIPIPNT